VGRRKDGAGSVLDRKEGGRVRRQKEDNSEAHSDLATVYSFGPSEDHFHTLSSQHQRCPAIVRQQIAQIPRGKVLIVMFKRWQD
jgi:hypothetical protein